LLDGTWPDTLAVVAIGAIPVEGPRRGLVDRDDDEVTASSIGVRREDGTGGRVTLAVHHAAVRDRAGRIAEALVLPDDLRRVLEDAAGWHDLGKIEDRFQAMLYGGDARAAAGRAPAASPASSASTASRTARSRG
jgi:CRISPR-associated endonuclease/helicase Cas3